MRKILLLLNSILLFSCNQNPDTQDIDLQRPDVERHGTELINSEFLKYADSSKVDSLEMLLRNSFDIYNTENFRIAHIDAEALSEFNFDFFLPDLNKILAKRDIRLSVQKLNNEENSYDVLINGDTIKLYTEKDLNNETFWDVAPRNFFQKLNEIAQSENVNERFYLLYGGNDLHAMFLSEKQFSIISAYYKNEPKAIPYKP